MLTINFSRICSPYLTLMVSRLQIRQAVLLLCFITSIESKSSVLLPLFLRYPWQQGSNKTPYKDVANCGTC